MKNSLNIKYTIQQVVYWAAAAGVISFASAFLLEKGFAASEIGVLSMWTRSITSTVTVISFLVLSCTKPAQPVG